jgi:integrase
MASIKRIGTGKYFIRVSRGTGKARKYTYKTFKGTLADARDHAREMESTISQGKIPESRLTFKEYADIWLQSVKPELAPLTYDSYKGGLDRYAEPLNDLKMDEITRTQIQWLYNTIDKGPTVRNLHSTLHALFNDAVRLGAIRINPCSLTKRPKKVRNPIVWLEESEADLFVQKCSEMRNGIIFTFALRTGMRPEEYLALRWSDLSATDAFVQRVVQFNRKGGGFYFKEPKTNKSRRRVPLGDDLVRLLKRHRFAQNEHRLKIKTWFNNDLIFPDVIGNPLQLNNLTNRYFRPILEKCEFTKRLTLYSLRHTCASLLLIHGVNPKIVSERLGHSSVVQTLDTYSHVLPHLQADATEIMNQIGARK